MKLSMRPKRWGENRGQRFLATLAIRHGCLMKVLEVSTTSLGGGSPVLKFFRESAYDRQGFDGIYPK
jgi:hypothetical protein